MPRYIDADLIPYSESENGCQDDIAYRYDINEIPTADVAPVVHGHRLTEDNVSICSLCGYFLPQTALFCMRCGAKIDEEEK